MDKSISRFFKEQYVVMDAALGTELERRGLDCPAPLWSASALHERGDDIVEIHREALEAGAQVLTSNTFRTTAYSYRKAGITQPKINARADACLAVRLSKKACEKAGIEAYIAGSLGPLEDCLSPEDVPDTDTLNHEHQHSVETLCQAGVDFIAIETVMTLRELRCMIECCQSRTIPYSILLRLQDNGTLYDGPLDRIFPLIQNQPPLFMGVNCLPPVLCSTLMTSEIFPADIPRAVVPNGEHFEGKRSSMQDYVDYSDVFLEAIRSCLKSRVSIFGGCCGTNSKYISKLNDYLRGCCLV